MSEKLDGLSSKTTSPDGPPAGASDQEKRMAERASLTKRLSISWRQKVTPAHGGDAHNDVASESAYPTVGELEAEPEAAGPGNKAIKPSLPHKLLALVPFMSPQKSKEPETGSAPPSVPPTAATKSEPAPSSPPPTAAIKTGPAISNLPPATINAGSPNPPPAAVKTGPSPTLPPVKSGSAPPSPPSLTIKTGPPQPGPATLAPAAVASAPPSSGVAPASAACVHSEPPDAPQQPAQTTTCAPSSPGLHPTFAAFLEKAAMVEAARVGQAATAATVMAAPRPTPAQRSPTAPPTTCAAVPVNFHADCRNPACADAFRRINDVRFVQNTFARINENYRTNYGIAEPIQAALNAAYQVLLECEYRTIMARIGSVATMLRQVHGKPTNEQDVLMHLLRRTGMQISRATPAPAATATPQRQSVHAGGGPMPAGAAAPAAGHAPAAVRTPVPVHTPAGVHTPAPAPASAHTPVALYAPPVVYTPAAGSVPPVGYVPQPGGNTAGMGIA